VTDSSWVSALASKHGFPGKGATQGLRPKILVSLPADEVKRRVEQRRDEWIVCSPATLGRTLSASEQTKLLLSCIRVPGTVGVDVRVIVGRIVLWTSQCQCCGPRRTRSDGRGWSPGGHKSMCEASWHCYTCTGFMAP
jgi:hypothetical protein